VVGETDWVPDVAVELVQPLGDVALQLVGLDKVELVTLQLRVLDEPEVMDVGLAVRDIVGAGVEEPTVTVAEAGVEPLELVQVIV